MCVPGASHGWRPRLRRSVCEVLIEISTQGAATGGFPTRARSSPATCAGADCSPHCFPPTPLDSSSIARASSAPPDTVASRRRDGCVRQPGEGGALARRLPGRASAPCRCRGGSATAPCSSGWPSIRPASSTRRRRREERVAPLGLARGGDDQRAERRYRVWAGAFRRIGEESARLAGLADVITGMVFRHAVRTDGSGGGPRHVGIALMQFKMATIVSITSKNGTSGVSAGEMIFRRFTSWISIPPGLPATAREARRRAAAFDAGTRWRSRRPEPTTCAASPT